MLNLTVSDLLEILNGEEEISDYLAVKLDNQFGGGVDIWKRLGSSVNATTNGLTIRLEPIHNVDIGMTWTN